MDNQRLIESRTYVAPTENSHMGFIFDEDVPESSHETETIPARGECKQPSELKMDEADMASIGQFVEHCIQQVSHLEMQRDELIQELLRVQEPMMRVLQHLREKLEETLRLFTLAQLDYISVYEDVQQVKRKLFATARDCIQSQVTLAQQEYQVAQSAVTKEELKAHIQTLNQELCQLQEAHQIQLNSLHDPPRQSCRPRAMSDVSQCRQASLKLQRRLSGSMKTLEGWYEPRLMALLKRRQAGENALRISREQAMDLRARLGPLRENIQRLEVQRSCLEQRISLIEGEREESLNQHEETVGELKETLRKVQVEFEIQRKSKEDLEDRNDGLLDELTYLRACDRPSQTPAEEHYRFSVSSGSS